jgi:hypothetical protein
VGTSAHTANTAAKSIASPAAYMPLEACASGPLVFAMRTATTPDAMAKAATYPPATTATLTRGLILATRNAALPAHLRAGWGAWALRKRRACSTTSSMCSCESFQG